MAKMWFSQCTLVIQKNLKLKKRSKCGTCCELIFPIILIIILFGFVQVLLPKVNDRYETDSIPPPSAWLSRDLRLLYTPKDAITTGIMESFSSMHLGVPLNDTDTILGFATGSEMEQFYLSDVKRTWAGVEFTHRIGSDNITTTTEYAIRIDFYELPDTEKFSNNDDGLDYNKDYIETGFLTLQLAIDSVLLSSIPSVNTTTFQVSISQFDFKEPVLWERILSSGLDMYQILGPIFIIIALFISNFRYLATTVAEKEFKIREEMRMMGLLPGVDNWASFTTVMMFATLPTIIFGIILSQIFYHNSSVISVLFLLFSVLFSLFALSMLVSLFVNKAKFAGILGFIVAVLMTILGIVFVTVDTNKAVKYFFALLSPAAFVFANKSMLESEKALVGTSASNMYDTWDKDVPSFGAMLGFIYLDTFLYVFLAWYIDNVFPGEFGIPRPPWFFVTKRYWSDTFGLKDTPSTGVKSSPSNDQDVEPPTPELKDRASVVINGLEKTFTRGLRKRTFKAVDGLDLTMYDGQITAFLGHNGAGKTTTISMLTGLVPVSGGDAFVRGYSIRNQMRQVRQTLGICPQHDVIWPELTVYDHLVLYAGLKGVPYGEIKRTVDDLIDEIGLSEKKLFPSGALSGGQKRKLCLAMAFIGGSDVIFLDEPTSGMDPVTRRGVWDFLNANKKGKTIVLTTHFMDEADFLGDRIAIISHGQLRCAGSSLFLKSRMGVGYLLVMTKNKSCDAQKVDDLVLGSIPGSQVLAAFGGELSYRLPKDSANYFSQFFSRLDEIKESMGIDSYGVSLTTLEEVFLRIGLEERSKHHQDDDDEEATLELTEIGKDQDKVNIALAHETKGHNFWQQFRAQLIKRATMYRRDLRGVVFTFLIPFALIVASSAVIGKTGTIKLETVPPAPLVLTTALYDRPYFAVGNINWLNTNPLFDTTTFIAREAANFDKFIVDDYKDRAAGAFFVDNLGSDLTTLPATISYGIQFNKTLLHVLPAEIAFVSNALLRRFTNNQQSISVVNKPFPHELTVFEQAVSSINTNLMYWSFIIFAAFCLIPSSVVASIVQERVLNIKRLMVVSGASRISYWASNFLFDWILYLILVLVTIIVVAIGGKDNFDSDAIGALFFLLLLYSLYSLAQSYAMSLLFNSYTVVTGALFGFHFLLGLILSTPYNMVTFRAIDGDASVGASDAVFFFAIAVSPQFGLMATLQRLGGFVGVHRKEDTWFTIYLVGYPLLMCAVHFFIWIAVLLFVEYRQMSSQVTSKSQSNVRTVTPQGDEDSDVTAERQRLINDPNASKDLVRVLGLRKEYPAPNGIKVAVKNLSLGIPRGECFGLLGMNGAGKSTTLGALSGDVTPTLGEVWLNGFNLGTSPDDALRYFGWCPQFDALIGTLTGREQLTMYARIKGLDEKIIPETVSAFLQMLDLNNYANRPVAGYSGGNKRKLSLAIAMIGNPPIVFLDEPSTGMDPLARRYMWNVISSLGANKSVVVTTHSMEECDALASRIGIMSQGELVCLGTSQHLKSRFASGYSIQLKTQDHNIDYVRAFIKKTFPASKIADHHGDLLAYELPQESGYSLSTIFAELQSLGNYLQDFSVSQTTLEQVFLKLAKEKAEGAKVEVIVA